MVRKKWVSLIAVIFVVCLVAHAYGAKDDPARVVQATIYFKIDSAEIGPEFENDLKKIQAALEADPEMGLRIEGYGHQQGAPQKYREVSQKRVQAVKQWFSENGIEKSRLMTINYSGTKPATRKEGPKEPSHSERVEIFWVSLKRPLAFLPAGRYQFDTVVEGQEVAHDFMVQNKGSAPLEIQKVKTD